MSSTTAPKGIDEFFRYFQAQNDQIAKRIQDATDTAISEPEHSTALRECSSDINALSEAVRDIVDTLPAHDRQTYLNGIKKLSADLEGARAKSTKKQKFSFKKSSLKMAASKAVPSDDAVATTDQLTAEATMQQPQISTIKQTGQLMDANSLSAGSSVIESLDSCVVDLRNAVASPVLRLSKITKSVLLIPSITGPVYLEDITRSILVLGCHQFRMHNSSGCEVYLHCTSRPIIEDCLHIRFAPAGRNELDSMPENKWDQVDDFKWLRSEPSPNWSALPEADRREVAIQSLADALRTGESVATLLDKLKLP